ncbi:hydroxyacylglutathione hydrolase [Roseicyclus sp. F158]|uniref:Hydroxyacylglutathione hydrolase n=1 Tax=Tropicimonas omnivorans TaxID=3075590 RepID=A0ABU3DFT7_9RHOB|nr:hydroxyacylglutathione hydrolase [Roseicyclus sp. F158]MDT0682569.1 hydroxyacylglutathione hydrolase [Roseicyclus sp. F158]
MPLEIVTVPCLSDNYAFIAHNPVTNDTAVIDVPEAGPIQSVLEARGWELGKIFITHHHSDHVGGVEELRTHWSPRVIGAKADAHRLPALDVEVEEGDEIMIGGEKGRVIDVSGHTMGHVAFHFPGSDAVFTADSLMAMGCGRLFEGDADTMWKSLSKLAALPQDTIVYSGHEYTAANARFAMTVDPENPALARRSGQIEAARAKGDATIPSSLAEEKETNPFLRAGDPAIRSGLGMEDASDAEVFAEIRRRKDNF